MGNFAHAGTAPRSPEVHERVFVGRILDHRSQGDDLPLGVALQDVDVGLAHVGALFLLGGGLQLRQLFGLLHFGREFGDLVENLLPRKLVGHVRHQHDAEEVVAVGLYRGAGQLLELLFDRFAALVGGRSVAVLGDQRAAGGRVGFGGVVGRGAGGVAHLRIVGVALDRDRTRFEDELHGERLRLSVARVEQVVHRGRSGGAAETEFTRFHDGRVDQAVLLEQVDGAFKPGDVAFDDVFGLRAATAQHGCGSCEEKCFFHCARILVYFLSSASCFSRLCTSFSSSGSRLKTAAERWYCMPGSAG